MLTGLRGIFERSWEKNGSEIFALCSGTLNRFLSGRNSDNAESSIPVFVFHSVEPQRFERQLQFLSNNGYTTLNAGSLLEVLRGDSGGSDKRVVLTFDDATGSFWATAYPLLKKYGFQGIVFVIPGLVPENSRLYPNLDDVWAGRANEEEILRREAIQPLCTWAELEAMHQSSIVDIQSHSMTHSRIFITSYVVDFLHPGFDTDSYGNVAIPVTQLDSSSTPNRPLRLGQPIYQSASRLGANPRYLENINLSEKMIAYVNERGGVNFFEHSGWRKNLEKYYQQLRKTYHSEARFESTKDRETAIRREMLGAKNLLEEKLPGIKIQHFCYPWYQGSSFSDAMAFEAGYRVVYYGFEVSPSQDTVGKNFPIKVPRIPDDFLCCLPGKGSESVYKAWIDKVWRVCRQRKKKNTFGTSAES